MELLEEKQILHVFFPRLGGRCFTSPTVHICLVCRRPLWLSVVPQTACLLQTSCVMDDLGLCLSLRSLLLHTVTQHLQRLGTALWSDVCRGRFGTIFKVMTRPLCFHGCHFSSVAPWRSLSSKKALSRLTDTSPSCLQSASFLPLLSRNVEFL